jgi:hypothetical protein
MSTLNIAGFQLEANREGASTAFTIHTRPRTVYVQLTDPRDQWPAHPDNTRHLKVWGLQIDRGDGIGWRWWQFEGDPSGSVVMAEGEQMPRARDPRLWKPVGQRKSDGGLPDIRVIDPSFRAAVGNRLRLAVISDSNIYLGARVVLTDIQLWRKVPTMMGHAWR